MISNHGKTYALVGGGNSKKLADALESSGANVVRFPPLRTEAAILDAKSKSILGGGGSGAPESRLTDFDWLIFTDIFAVDYFLQALEESGTDFFELDALRVCALGEAVADRLRFAALHADVIPNFVDADAVLIAVAAYVGESDIAGKRFLVVKKRGASGEIENKITAAGASAAVLEIYQSEIAAGAANETARLKALLAGGAIDEFVFSAPADLLALGEFLPGVGLAEILRGIKISAADEVTFQSIREHDLEANYFRRK